VTLNKEDIAARLEYDLYAGAVKKFLKKGEIPADENLFCYGCVYRFHSKGGHTWE